MELERLKHCADWFKVHELKDVADPSGQVARKEIVVSLDQYPYDFGLGPNPREPDPTSRVSKKIGETLEGNWQNFHLLNRGAVVVAKHLDYDNKSQRVRFVLGETEEEKKVYGILDGGNTNERINIWRRELTEEEAEERLPRTFVNLQVLIPQLKGADEPPPEMMGLLNEVKDARNTSVQVKQKSLADSGQQFETLKSVLEKEPYFDQISWHEGQKGSIDALQIVILLMMYYPNFSKAADGGEPSNAYGHKERCLDAFLEYADSEPEELKRWIGLLPEMIRLFDELQQRFPDHYEGRFGKIKEVQIYEEKKYERGNKKYRKSPLNSMFFGVSMKYSYPVGWLYPVFAAFRFLAGPDTSGKRINWKRDPLDFWNQHGKEICERYMPHIISAGYEPRKIATNPLCYQAVRQAVTDLFKDDLLRKAGISV
jgi:AIPR protein